MRRLTLFATGLLLGAALVAWFNYARYGTIFDQTLWRWFQIDTAGAAAHPGHGPFSPTYLPLNLYVLFWYGARFTHGLPAPDGYALALLLVSPAWILTLRAPLRSLETVALWLTILLVSLPSLTVYAPGYVQFGCRYYTQVAPFLLVLLARQPVDQIAKILIAASILIVAVGMAEIRTWGFGG